MIGRALFCSCTEIDPSCTYLSPSDHGDLTAKLAGTGYARRIGDLHRSNPFLKGHEDEIPEPWYEDANERMSTDSPGSPQTRSTPLTHMHPSETCGIWVFCLFSSCSASKLYGGIPASRFSCSTVSCSHHRMYSSCQRPVSPKV